MYQNSTLKVIFIFKILAFETRVQEKFSFKSQNKKFSMLK